ncbi:hypothetical protein [Streptomyces flavofungini]|uniref:Ribbon-helix-helix protein CopG domain-containing protein n=1 Tax=Streptomyces flavofungini TaxID=68200 RepID=A0ABS0X6S2_9ACTN|nr:hypothetical protein [Streptomyces flavofungini]MBJ3808900.1 hypothetical protein [Streptomyces flavofungini]GHC48487.1 hypothetical protein GCM10010349_12300 [Streptomyces flavofungini]
MDDSTIKVPEDRDHLAAVAKERGTTTEALVAALAAEQLTTAQSRARVAEARKVLRERMGVALTDEEFDRTPHALDRVYEVAAQSGSTTERTGTGAGPDPGQPSSGSATTSTTETHLPFRSAVTRRRGPSPSAVPDQWGADRPTTTPADSG